MSYFIMPNYSTPFNSNPLSHTTAPLLRRFLLDAGLIDSRIYLPVDCQHVVIFSFSFFLGLSMWPSPLMASATVHRYFLQWTDYSVGLRTITKSLCQVRSYTYCSECILTTVEIYIMSYYLTNISSPLKGITPSNSSRTRTPASLNATPANINIAGEFRSPPHTQIYSLWSCNTFLLFPVVFLPP